MANPNQTQSPQNSHNPQAAKPQFGNEKGKAMPVTPVLEGEDENSRPNDRSERRRASGDR